MDPEDQRVIRHFTLSDLGVLHGPPLKGSVIVAEMVREALQTDSAAFFVFDTLAGEMIVRAATRQLRIGTTYPLHLSAITALTESTDAIAIGDMSQDASEAGERSVLGMTAVLAAPVLGPDGNPLGALAALDNKPRAWSELHKRWLVDLAYLVTQEITLHASFRTLEILLAERKASHS